MSNILVEKRQVLGLKQKEVAQEVGVSLSAYAMWERQERNIKSKYIKPLSKILQIKEEDLIKEFQLSYAFVWKDRINEIKNEEQNIDNDIKELKKIKQKHLKIIKKIDKCLNILNEEV